MPWDDRKKAQKGGNRLCLLSTWTARLIRKCVDKATFLANPCWICKTRSRRIPGGVFEQKFIPGAEKMNESVKCVLKIIEDRRRS